VSAGLCVSYLPKTCKYILSCTEFFVCKQEDTMPPKRKKRVQKCVGGQVYVGVLLRGSERRGGRRHSHRMMMMIAFITFKSSLVPLFEGL